MSDENKNNTVAGKTVVLTGVTSGLGLAAAKHLISLGANVVGSGRRESKGAEVQKALGDKNFLFVKSDASVEDDFKALLAAAEKAFGKVSVILLNAGIEGQIGIKDYGELDIKAAEKLYAVNVLGPLIGLKYGAPLLEKNGGGDIVITSSVASVIPFFPALPYAGTKSAVDSFVKSAATFNAEKKNGVNVYSINPFLFESEMATRFTGGGQQQDAMASALNPSGKVGRGIDFAQGIVTILSGKFPAGTSVAVDYGPTLYPVGEAPGKMAESAQKKQQK